MIKKPAIKEMQTWNERYKIDEDPTYVIDTESSAKYWTHNPNEAGNLCIALNMLNRCTYLSLLEKQHNEVVRLQDLNQNLIDVCEEADKLIKSHILKHYKKWMRFCKIKGVYLDND